MAKITLINDDAKHEKVKTPQNVDERSFGGTNPDPESDDNVLDVAHEAGIYGEADEEHPAELDIAREIEEKKE